MPGGRFAVQSQTQNRRRPRSRRSGGSGRTYVNGGNPEHKHNPGDADLFRAIGPHSSEDIRRLLGSHTFGHLKARAKAEGASLNAYSLKCLRRAAARPDSTQLDLFPRKRPEDLPFNPIQATYRGGVAEPLHGWYPYLEGYSPDFVKNVLGAFAPAAARVLDPFAGTGTTPLTAAATGRKCFYYELNPLLQFLIETKARILAMPRRDRLRPAARVRNQAERLESSLAEHEPDRRLIVAYTESFGNSEFFPTSKATSPSATGEVPCTRYAPTREN